jgi:outer membrane protein TolC
VRLGTALACAAIVAGGAALGSTARAETETVRQGADPLTLDEVLRSVDRTYPLLAAAAREQDEAAGALLSAEGGFDPSLKASGTYEPISGYPKQYMTAQIEQPTALWGTSVFAGYRYGSGKIPIYEGKLETNEYGEARGGVRVPLWRDGPIDRRRASLRQAELGVTLARLSVDQQRIEARRLASLRYWDWVAAGRKVTILRGWLALAVERDAGLAVRSERGDIPEIDRTENQRTILQRQTAIIAAERDVAAASLELSLFLRAEDGTTRIPEPPRLPALKDAEGDALPSARAEEERALARRPDLRRFEMSRERSRIEADLARNQQRPAIDVMLWGARQFGPGDPARGEPILAGSVVLDIPILNRVSIGREQAAEATISRLEEQRRFTRDRIVADVRATLIAIDAARQRAAMAKKEVEVATQLARAELRRFELGDGNLLLVNLREQTNAEAAIREIDALADYHRAVAMFRAATARDVDP